VPPWPQSQSVSEAGEDEQDGGSAGPVGPQTGPEGGIRPWHPNGSVPDRLMHDP
jgi:hypothetical protein